MSLSSNISLLGRLVVLILAFAEWALMLLYVYCLKRFRQNYLVKLSLLVLTLLCLIGVPIAQRQLYQPVSAGRLSMNEFDVVVIIEAAVSIFILFYGMRKFWRRWAPDTSGQDGVP
jgi:hypothetical protein